MRLIIAVFSIFCLSSCAQLTRLDTARTIGDGNTELGAQVSAYGADDQASPALGAVAVPFLVVDINHGVTDHLDLMFSANTAANIFFSPKYQIVGDQESQLAVAVLPGLDMQLGNLNEMDEPFVYFRPHLSSIISLHQDNLALFFEPKYIYQYWTKTHFMGTTVGVDYSMERTSFALGVSYFSVLGEDNQTGENIFNVGFGVRRLLNFD